MKATIQTLRLPICFRTRLTLNQSVRVLPFFVLALLLLAATAVRGQSAYSNAVVSLNPAGYWPMHEVEAAAPGDTETNYGTLGLLGTGYYPDWAGNNYGGIVRNASGALANDTDTSAHFTHGTGNTGTAVFYTNGLYVPVTSPLTTLNPPFSVECWYYPTNAPTGEDIWCQMGYVGLNQGNEGSDVGNVCGMRMVWANSGFVVYYLDNEGGVGVLNSQKLGSPTESLNQWYHLVVTCSASTNITVYVNGTQVATGNKTGQFSPDHWTPINIGCGQGNTRSSAGSIDEFAVYTNVITDISQHYTDGTAGAAGAYFHDVTNDNAVIYLRMDAPAYTTPNASTWPVVANDGNSGVNGVYTPGTVPGILSGPLSSGVSFGGIINNSALLSGVSSFADVGTAAAYNPTGSNANFTVSALFRGNPCDGRIQSIVGHGTNSWQLGVTTNGCLVFNAGNGNKAAGGTGSAAGDIKTIGVYNDGNWHQVVAVDSTNVISIYVDGALDTNGTPAGITATNIIPGNTDDVMIGSDPTYTNNPVGKGRSFAGRVCDVAFFPGALTAGQVQTLYNASGVVPSITGQPVSGRVAIGGAGSSINFGVNATGSALSYQWYFNTSSNYTGATELVNNVHYANSTTSQVTLNNLTSADDGYYFVVITNNEGSVTSILASLTVADLAVWKGNVNNNWDIGATPNWIVNGGSSVYNDGDAVQFDDSASLFNVNLAANVSPADTTVTNNRNAYTLSGANAVLTGTLLKTGTNALTLAVVDSGSGVTVSAGTLIVGDGTTNGAVTAGSIVDNSALEFAETNGSCSVPISGSGSVEVIAANGAGSGNYTLSGLNSYLGNTVVSSGTLNMGSDFPALPGGGIVIVNTNALLNVNGVSLTVNGLSGNGIVDNLAAGAATFTVGINNTNSTFAGSINNTSGLLSLTKTNAGTLYLTGTNSFTGVFTFGGGIVNVASFSDYSDAPTPNAGPSALGERASTQEIASGNGIGLSLSGGTLQYTGSTPQETDRQIRLLNTTSTIDASGSNPGATLYWSWGDVIGGNVNLFNTVGGRTLQLAGSNTGTNTFDIQVTDQGVNGTAVTKSGVGTWYMLGASAASPPGNAYSGATTVSGGTLLIATTHNDNGGSAISANGLGTFTVSDGGTLGVTDGHNSEPALMKTLTVGSSAGATLEFLNIPSSGVPMIKATNSVAFHGNSTIVCSTNNLTAGTVYPLLAYGTLSGGFTLAAMPGPLYYKLTNDTVNIDLIASATPLVNLNPTNIVFSEMNNQLVLSWPADHTGWTLQAQTNSLGVGLNTNWVRIPGSSSVDSITNSINVNNGCVFYRLVYP